MSLSQLTPLQRIHRRLSMFWQRAYTHPDGHIELDFEEPAGIDSRNDSDKVQEKKLARWEVLQAEKQGRIARISGALFVGLGIY